MGLGLFVGVWLARYLKPEAYGLLNYAFAFVGMFGIIASLGIPEIVVRDLIRKPLEAGITLGTSFALRLLGGLIAYLFANVIISFLSPNDIMLRIVVAILSLMLIIQAIDVIRYWFESQLQSKFMVWVDNIVFFAIAGIKVILILFHATLIVFVIFSLIEAFIVAIFLFIVYKRKVRNLKTWTVSIVRAKELLYNSWPLIFSGVVISIYMKIDQIMIGKMLNNYQVGIYAAAVRISEVWYFIPSAIITSLYPTIINLKKQNKKDYELGMKRLYWLMVWIAVPIGIIVSIWGSQIINLLFGSEYIAASGVLSIHIWSSIFVFIGLANNKWLINENMIMIISINTLIGAIANVGLNIILIPKIGILGAAWATLIAYFLAAYFCLILHKKTRNNFLLITKSIIFNPFKNVS